MKFLSENQILHQPPDIVEKIVISEKETIIYTGLFKKGFDENSKGKNDAAGGCIIKRIIIKTEGNKETTETKFAGSDVQSFLYTWKKRETYNYGYSGNK